jgi:hypothetical protein
VTLTYDSVGLDEFAKPQAVLQQPDGWQSGGVATTMPVAKAIAAR